MEDLRQAADLGISHLDAHYVNGKLNFTVHNIGAKVSSAFQVIVKQNGKILSKQRHDALLAPEKFQTHKAVFAVPVADANSPVTIEAIPEGELAEITTVNNNVTFIPAEHP